MSTTSFGMKQAAWFTAAAANTMIAEGDRKKPLETGGVLMGYFTASQAVIAVAIGPGPKARHGRYSFTPDYDWQDQKISEIYADSGRRLTYLGDWHTHPQGFGALSMKDIDTLHSISNFRAARVPSPIMAVLYGEKHWQLTVWNYVRTRRGISIGVIKELNIYNWPSIESCCSRSI